MSHHARKSIPLLLSGVIAGMAFVIACGDNLQLSADAASDAPKITDASLTCDCLAAEPPLAGRFVVVSQFQIISPNTFNTQSVPCPIGATLIAGNCTISAVNPVRNANLQQSGFFDVPPSAWACMFRNNEATPITIRVSLICLEPAP